MEVNTINDSNDCAAAHQIAVASASTINQKSTGNRPKYAESATTNGPPAPSINTFPTWEWLTWSSVIFHALTRVSHSIKGNVADQGWNVRCLRN